MTAIEMGKLIVRYMIVRHPDIADEIEADANNYSMGYYGEHAWDQPSGKPDGCLADMRMIRDEMEEELCRLFGHADYGEISYEEAEGVLGVGREPVPVIWESALPD